MVTVDNDAWKMYFLLADTFNIIMAPVLEINDISYLQMLIPDFLFSFATHSPDLLKPKFHFLVHHSTLMKNSGQLRMYGVCVLNLFIKKSKKCSKHSKFFKC